MYIPVASKKRAPSPSPQNVETGAAAGAGSQWLLWLSYRLEQCAIGEEPEHLGAAPNTENLPMVGGIDPQRGVEAKAYG